MLTTHDVLTFLQDVGIRQNDKVTIHCSLRSIGKIENGADGLIDESSRFETIEKEAEQIRTVSA